MADQAVRSLSSSLFGHLNRLLPQLMIPLNPARRQLVEVNVTELVPAAYFILFARFYVLRVPLLADALVRGHIVHYLVVHRTSKTGQHEEEYCAVHECHCIENVYKLHPG